MQRDDGTLQARLTDLKRRANEASSDEERLKVLAEATILQQLIQHFPKKNETEQS